MNRVIGHVDLDYFYAQVEEVENPTIKGRPVVVCVFSGRTEDSGVVSAANYRAREFGVRSGTPIVVAKRRLEGKDPVMVRMEIAKYEAVSERVMDLVRANVDVLEKVGIDEAFFDLTSSSGGDFRKARVTAGRIKETILAEEHLACSIGLGRSKAVAKLGSDSAKPGGLIVVPSEETEVFMKDTEVIKLYGVGPKTAETLDRMQIRTIGELARSDVTRLEDTLGRKLAVYLHAASNGIDGDPVLPEQEPTQYSRIITLKDDTTDAEEVMSQLSGACDSLRGKLATAKKSFRTITAIAILTDLSTKTRSRTFQTPVSDISSVKKTTLELFEQLSETADKGFRRVGIRVSDLVGNQDQQSLSGYLRAK